jgi:hypothetical protein
MRKFSFFLPVLFLSSFIFVGVVSAQEPTPTFPFGDGTPVPTFTQITTPISPTDFYPTSQSYECPPGAPDYFMTKTPSSSWMALCGECLPMTEFPTFIPFDTSTPAPVPTWDGTGTPPSSPSPTVTLEATSTSTPFPTPTFETSPYTLSVLPFGWSPWGSACASGVKNTTCELLSGGQTVHCVLDHHVQDTSASAGCNVNFYVEVSSSNSDSIYVYWDVTGTSYSEYTTFSLISGSNPPAYQLENEMYTPANNHKLYYRHEAPVSYIGSIDFTGDLYFSLLSDYGFSPTPTPTPVPVDSYCSSIQDENDLWDNDTFGFGFGDIIANKCITTPSFYPGYILNWFSLLAPDPIGFFAGLLEDILNTYMGEGFGLESWTICVSLRDSRLYLFGYQIPYQEVIAFGVVLAALGMVTGSFSGLRALGGNDGDVSYVTTVTTSNTYRNSDGSRTTVSDTYRVRHDD